MVELLRPGFHRFVRQKPHISGAAPIRLVAPPSDVRFVFERNADRDPIYGCRTCLGKVKYRLVIMIEVPPARNRLEMPNCIVSDAYRFDPSNTVLQVEDVSKNRRNVLSNPRVGVCAATFKKNEPFWLMTRPISLPISPSQRR
jgi:hypothetical protein